MVLASDRARYRWSRGFARRSAGRFEWGVAGVGDGRAWFAGGLADSTDGTIGAEPDGVAGSGIMPVLISGTARRIAGGTVLHSWADCVWAV